MLTVSGARFSAARCSKTPRRGLFSAVLGGASKKIAKKIKINLQLKKMYVSLHPLSRERLKIIDNTERENEVKKEKDIVCMKAGREAGSHAGVISISRRTGERIENRVIRRDSRARERGEGRTGDAWASGSDEGRGKLRKSTGIRKQEVIRGSPNGGTRTAECRAPARAGANAGN